MKSITDRIHVILLYFTVLVSLANQNVIAQCSSSGPRSGSAFSSDNSAFFDYSFGTPGNASASDNARAIGTATLSILEGNTEYLKASGFGFSIPVTASICGIVVEVEKSAANTNFLTSINDNSVRLIKNGTVTGNNYASGTSWSTTEGYTTYGGISNLWGTTWTPGDINSANFGVAISATIHAIVVLLPSARVDHIRITVHYLDIILPLTLSSFLATPQKDHSAKLQWTISNNDEECLFNIQRKTAGNDWQTLSTLRSEINKDTKTYQYNDVSCSASSAFYRLQIKQSSGKISYSEIVPVKWKQEELGIYPNPATDYIFIQSKENPQTVACSGIDGHIWKMNYKQAGTGLYKMNITHLPRGTYILNVNEEKKLFIRF